MNIDESVLEEKPSFKMLGVTFYSKFDWGSYTIPFAKSASIKIGALIFFFLLRLNCISINLPYTLHGILMSHLGGYLKLLLGIVR